MKTLFRSLMVLSLAATSTLFAQATLAPTFTANTNNYVPGGNVEFTINLNHDGSDASGASFTLFLPDGWGDDGVNWVSGLTPNQGPDHNAFANDVAVAWFAFAGDLPGASEDLVISISVPAEFEGNASINLQASWGDANVNSADNPLIINPPAPPNLTSPNPAQNFLATQTPSQIGNTVTAGDSITFSIVINPAAGATLAGTGFWLSPAEFFEGKWETQDETAFLTRRGAGEDEEGIFFSDNRGTLTPVGDNTFTWTIIGDTQPGTRTFTWDVPSDIVTKSTPEADRVFVAGVGARQDNGAEDEFEWAVLVLPVNQAPVFTDPTVDGQPDAGPVVVQEAAANTFAITATDPDETDVLIFDWYVDDVLQGTRAASDLTHTFDFDTVAHPAQEEGGHTVRVVVSDGDGGTDSFTWDVTVEDVNRAPNAPAVQITAGDFFTTDDLVCTVTPAGDPDDREGYDEPLSYTYVWTNELTRAVVTHGPTTETSDTLSSDQTAKGESWQCEVTVTDDPYGDGTGAKSTGPIPSSNTVTILNTEPTVQSFSVFIQKPTPLPQDAPSEEITLRGSDADADDLTFIITSLPEKGTLTYEDAVGRATVTIVAGDLPQALPGNLVTYTVDAPNTEFFDPPDTFTYIASDGDNPLPSRGESQPATVTVTYRENQPPAVISMSPGEITGDPTTTQTFVVPDPIDEGESIDFSAGFSDDTDPSGQGEMQEIQWYVNGVLKKTTVPAGVRAPLSSDFTFETDFDTISNTDGSRRKAATNQIRALGRDTQGGYNTINWTVTLRDVDQETPAPTVVTIEPAQPTTTDDLTAVVAAENQPVDPDGDEIIRYNYVWEKVTANQRQDLTSQTLSSVETKKGEIWQVTVTPVTDPYGDGGDDVISPNSQTAQVTIVNTVPVAGAIASSTDEETPVQIDLETGVTDPDVADGTDTLDFDWQQPSHGTVEEVVDTRAGSLVVYTPDWDELAQGEVQDDSFEYSVSDGDAEDTGTVTVSVTGVNDIPTAESSSAYSEANEVVFMRQLGPNYAEIETLTGDDIDSDDTPETLVYKISSLPTDGILTDSSENPIDNPADLPVEVTAAMQPLRYYPDPDFRGTDSFTFTATDQHGATSEPATVTITVGTPLWYPYIEWDAVQRPDSEGDFNWYNVQIWDGVPGADGSTKVLDSKIKGLALTVVEYFKAGNEGLLPGTSYYWRYRTWVPRTDTYGAQWLPEDQEPVRGEEALVVEDYGYAGAATSFAVEVPQVGGEGDSSNRYRLTFIVPNARGYNLEMTGPDGFFKAVDHIFWPDANGNIPLNQPETVEIVLNMPGTYQWQVRGFNPLDERDDVQTWVSGPEIVVENVAQDGEAPAVPVLVSPANGDPRFLTETEQLKEVTLKWTRVSGATDYVLYLASINQGPIVNRRSVGDVESYTTTLPKGSYTWMVLAKNAADQYSQWSEIWNFDVSEHTINDVLISGVTAGATAAELIINLHPDSAPLATVDLHHFDNETGSWQVYQQVAVVGGSIILEGADFDSGEFVFIRGTSDTGQTSEFKLLEIE